MVGTICPMVHAARTRAAGKTVLLAHAVGSLSGSALAGGLAGTLGACLFAGIYGYGGLHKYKALGIVFTAILCILYLIDEMGIIQLPHPQSALRVPSTWRLQRPFWAATIYGFALGGGIGTPIALSGLYVVILWSVITASPTTAGLVFLGYGFGRVLPIIALSTSRSPDAAVSRVDLACWNLSLIHSANDCALAFAATILIFNAVY